MGTIMLLSDSVRTINAADLSTLNAFKGTSAAETAQIHKDIVAQRGGTIPTPAYIDTVVSDAVTNSYLDNILDAFSPSLGYIKDGSNLTEKMFGLFGHEITAAGVARPTYVASGQNSKPALDFDGVGNVMTRSNPNGWDVNDMTIFVVGQFDSVVSNDAIFSMRYTTDPQWAHSNIMLRTLSSNFNGLVRSEAGGFDDDSSTGNINYHIFEIVWPSSNAATFRIDNADLFTVTKTPIVERANRLYAMHLGAYYVNSALGSYFDGEISEVWVLNTTDTAKRTALRSRLAHATNGYNITLS